MRTEIFHWIILWFFISLHYFIYLLHWNYAYHAQRLAIWCRLSRSSLRFRCAPFGAGRHTKKNIFFGYETDELLDDSYYFPLGTFFTALSLHTWWLYYRASFAMCIARWYSFSSCAHILQLLQTSRIFHWASFQCQVAHFSFKFLDI